MSHTCVALAFPPSLSPAKPSWPVLSIFQLMQRLGKIEEGEMFRTFNMGIGMVIVCSPSNVSQIQAHFGSIGNPCYEIGRVTNGDRRVHLV